VSATSEHELLVAMAARYIRDQGYELVAIESSFSWLFGDDFRLPPSVVLHRPDVIGIRKEPPLICIGEGKTRNDLHSIRTREQLRDFTEASVQGVPNACGVVIAIPRDCKATLDQIVESLGVSSDRIKVLPIPRVLLSSASRP
jgi:hypothetical protein